jgi:phage terminase small subunit
VSLRGEKEASEEMSEEENIELTDKQEKFCYEYCLDFNATQAAIRAGYSESTARSIASQLLTKVNIKEKIKEMQDNLAETSGMGRLRVINEHIKIAFSSIAHLHDTWIKRKDFESLTEDQKACIAEIDTKIRTEYEYDPDTEKRKPIKVEYVRIKLYDKQKALDAISKMLGYDAPIKMQIGLDAKNLPDIIIK